MSLASFRFPSRWTPLPRTIRFPLSGRARDFHPLDYAHVGRTRKNAANRLAIDCIYNSFCNKITYFPSFPSVLLDEFVFVVAVFDEVARGRRVGLEPIDQRLFFGCDGGTFVFVRLVSFRFCSAFLFSSALLLAFSRSKAMRLRSLIS